MGANSLMARNRTKDVDKGHTKIIRELKKHDGSFVEVGFFEGEDHPESGLPVAAVAAINEYGAENIPERSFIRSTIDTNKAKYRLLLRQLIAKVAIGDLTNKQALEQFAIRVKSDIQRKITTLKTPANAPSTVAQKGSSNPLIDTGTMRANVDYKVRE